MTAVATFAALAFAGCYDATQVTVEITTDIPCDENMRVETGVLIGPDESLATSDRAFSALSVVCANGKIGSIVLVPSDSRSDVVRIEVVANVGVGGSAEACRQGGAGCVLAKRRLRYLPHRGVHLPIALTGGCVGATCSDPNATCIRGACAAASCADPATCSEDSLLAASDGGTPVVVVPPLQTPLLDGGTSDAASEGGSTVTCDAGDDLVPLCYRDRDITVPCSLAGGYVSRGAKPGKCVP